MIKASENVISGAPFDAGDASPLFKAFTEKIGELDADIDTKNRLKHEASEALLNHLGPAYQNLITMFRQHQSLSDDQDGVWKLPDGKAYYQSRLKHYTTTDMTANEIHNIGLKEVARIQEDMRAIMKTIGFTGSLQDFFDELRTNPKFTYSDDDQGRARYLSLIHI